MIVWTASSGNPERIESLQEMIHSVKSVYIDAIFHISISSMRESPIHPIPNVHIHTHERRMSQFQHLQYINSICQSLYPSDASILFMDDDDILIDRPDTNASLISGYQYILPGRDTSEQHISIDQDFSGYIAPLSVVQQYFNTHDRLKYGIHLEDAIFTKYLDEMGAQCPSTPFVYHRYIPGGEKRWVHETVHDLYTLLNQYKYLITQMN